MNKKENNCVSQEEIYRQNSFLDTISHEWTKNFISRNGRKPIFCCQNYGCQMNEHDSENIKGMMIRAGFDIVERGDADFVLFNTCCVRDHAEQRVFGNIGALAKTKTEHPEMIIGVCGCMMQQQDTAKQLFRRFPYVDIVFGTHALYSFPELLYRTLTTGSRVFDTRESDGQIAEHLPTLNAKSVSAYVTIMYGCNNFCTYCIVPYVRGRERSRKPDDILFEIQELTQKGVCEITLLGQNVNSYGKDLDDDIDFAKLLREIDKKTDVKRIRFMTSHPKDLSDALIEAMAQCDTLCKHIHLPVQSGSNNILKRMNRKYSREEYLLLIEKLRKQVPDIEITTDIIVGFPGESEVDFLQTLDLVDQVGFASAFTFMYSPRTGTSAAIMEDQIDKNTKKERLLILNELQARKCAENNSKYVGKALEVLVEGCDERGIAYGKTGNFKTINFPGEPSLIGKFKTVKVEECKKNALVGY